MMNYPKPTAHRHELRKAPTSVAEIDQVMNEMDSRFSTSFQHWITSPDNIGYLSTFKKSLFEDQWNKGNCSQTANAVNWICKDWSIGATAELILKLFYSWRLDSEDFAKVVSLITQNWIEDRREELVDIILIGESAWTTAKFVSNLTHNWMTDDTRKLCRNLFLCMNWSEEFLCDFVFEYASLNLTEKTQPIFHELQGSLKSWRSLKKLGLQRGEGSKDFKTEFLSFGIRLINSIFCDSSAMRIDSAMGSRSSSFTELMMPPALEENWIDDEGSLIAVDEDGWSSDDAAADECDVTKFLESCLHAVENQNYTQ